MNKPTKHPFRASLFVAVSLTLLTETFVLSQGFLTKIQLESLAKSGFKAAKARQLTRGDAIWMIKDLNDRQKAINEAAKKTIDSREFEDYEEAFTNAYQAIENKKIIYEGELDRLALFTLISTPWNRSYIERKETIHRKLAKLQELESSIDIYGYNRAIDIGANEEEFKKFQTKRDLLVELHAWDPAGDKGSFSISYSLHDEIHLLDNNIDDFITLLNREESPAAVRKEFVLNQKTLQGIATAIKALPKELPLITKKFEKALKASATVKD